MYLSVGNPYCAAPGRPKAWITAQATRMISIAPHSGG